MRHLNKPRLRWLTFRPVFNALPGACFVTAAQFLFSARLLEELARSSPNIDAAKVVANRVRDILAGADLEKVMNVFMVEIRTSFFSLAENGFYCSSGFTNASEGIGALNVVFQSCVYLYMDEQWLQAKHNGVSAEGEAPLAKTRTRSWCGRVSVNG